MPLGMAPCSCAQYDLAGHTDDTPTSPRNLPISSHAGAPGAAADGTAGAATGAEAVVDFAPWPRELQISPPCAFTMPSMALNRNYKLRRSNCACCMVHTSKNFLHVTRNKLRNGQ